jgi:DNA (cytosine-5)-methyltransferase 1
MKTFVEFFAGVGLVREGLAIDDWTCQWANDISPDKKDTYISNFGDNHFHLGDIWDIAADTTRLPDNTFLYTASFPCTDLSVAGNRAGLAGEHSGTLNALFEILESKKNENNKPKVVLLENVKGFLTSHGGEDVRNTVNLFSELGYYVDIIELDASYFTPQSRQRVFMIAVDTDLARNLMLIKDPGLILDNWWSAFDREPILRSEKVRRIIEKYPELNWGLFDIAFRRETNNNLGEIIETCIPDDSKFWWNEERKAKLYAQMNKSHRTKLDDMMKNDCYSYGTVFRRMRKGKSTAEFRTDGIAGCLRTPRGGSSKQILIRVGYNSWSVRLLSPREYARLQGVRDTFKLPENQNKGFFAMGDAVCVPVIEFISVNILTPVYNYWHLNERRQIE